MSEQQEDGPPPDMDAKRAADWWRGYHLAENIKPLPPGKPFAPRGSGWRKRVGGKMVMAKPGGHYDVQGGLGSGTPSPPINKPDPA